VTRTRELLAGGADPNTHRGRHHLLQLAGNDETRAALLEAGAWSETLAGPLLCWVIDRDRADLLATLASRGVDLEEVVSPWGGAYSRERAYSWGRPLQLAANLGRASVVATLLALGLDPT